MRQARTTSRPVVGHARRQPLPAGTVGGTSTLAGRGVRRQHEDAGPGAGDDGRVSLAPEGVDEAHRLRVRRAPRPLVQPVAGGGSRWSGAGVRAWTSRAARPGCRRRPSGDVRGQHRPGGAGGQLLPGTRTTTRRRGGATDAVPVADGDGSPGRGIQLTVRPPWTLAEALSGWPSSTLAMSVATSRSTVDDGSPASAASSSASESACAATTPATMAVADDPRPRLCGTPLRASRRRPAGRRLEPGDPVRHGAHTRCGRPGHLVGALARDRHLQAGRPRRHVDDVLVPQPEREPDRVEPGAEVGAARRHAHADRGSTARASGCSALEAERPAAENASTETRIGTISEPSACAGPTAGPSGRGP